VLLGETDLILGQLEVSTANYGDVEILIKRKPFGGRSDINFSLTKKALHSMVSVLREAEEKLEKYWLSEFVMSETASAKQG
jgi:hypothetical protein